MGGVDLSDHTLSNLRPVICGKKCYWLLVINALYIVFVYSWRLYRIVSGKTVPQKDFRRHIVGIIIRKSKPCVISVNSRQTEAHKVADEVRYDGLGRYPISFGNGLFVGKLAEIHGRSAYKAYMSRGVSRFSMKSDSMMRLLPQHVLYSLSKICPNNSLFLKKN